MVVNNDPDYSYTARISSLHFETQKNTTRMQETNQLILFILFLFQACDRSKICMSVLLTPSQNR